MRKALRIIGWLFAGLAASIAVLLGYVGLIEAKIPVSLPSLSVSARMWDDGYVFATGTWVAENNSLAFPFSTTEIRCLKRTMTCHSAESSISGGGMLSADYTAYDITKWDNTTLVYTNDARCVSYTYTVDRLNERMIATRRTKNPAPDGCDLVEKNAINLSLADGFRTVQRMRQDVSRDMLWLLIGALVLVWAFVVVRAIGVIRQ